MSKSDRWHCGRVDTSDVLASVAIGLSAISLGWQAWSHRAKGPVVGVTTSITVTGWGLRLPNGDKMVPTQSNMISKRLPHRLEANTSASWFVETDRIRLQCAEMGLRYQDLRGFVMLGTGEQVPE
jgi:hypothetical protein